MARPAALVVDETALTARKVDVEARAGWLLRMSRLAAGRSLEETARALTAHGVRTSVPQLSRIETGALRMGVVTDGYETALGLTPGRLRAAVDVLARTYRSFDADQRPDRSRAGLAEYDAAVEPVLGDDPTGGDWLRFARVHRPESVGLPSSLMRPLVARLGSEMVRAVGTAFVTRYEALTRLRLTAYAGVVAAMVRDAVGDPRHPSLPDLMSAVAERPTPGLLAWAGQLLDHERDHVATSATITFINSRAIGGLPQRAWEPVPAAFVAAWTSPRANELRRGALTGLFANLPRPVRADISARLGGPPPRPPGPTDWTPSRRNRHYAVAEQVADRACRRAGLPEQPMLTRLVFEMLYDYRAERAVTSAWLVGASPFAVHVLSLLVDLGTEGADDATRRGAATAVVRAQGPEMDLDPTRLLASDDEELRASGLRVAGQAGRRLTDELARRVVTEQPRLGLYALGMTQHPVLGSIARSWPCPDAVRAGARWWLAEGGRVVA